MTKKAAVFFTLFCISLIFIASYPVFGADESGPGKISSNKLKPLDYIFFQIEKIKEPSLRCALLNKIAGAHTQLGEYAESEKILTQALEIAKDIENQIQRSMLLSEIADELIGLHKNEAAMELLQYIEDAEIRASVLIKIISGYLKQNRYEEAVELIQEIHQPTFRALALFRIIERMTAEQRYEKLANIRNIIQLQPASVQKSLRLIFREEDKKTEGDPVSNLFASKTSSKKIRALVALAKNKFALGDTEAADYILGEALSLIEYIKGDYVKDDCLAKIGICYLKIGRPEKARALAGSIKIPFSRAELLAATAITYAENNESEAALGVISDVDVQFFKEQALSRIIILYLEQGKEKQVNEIMQRLENAPSRSRVYAAAISYCLQKKNFTPALELSRKIEDTEIKIIAMIEIAGGLQKEGLAFPRNDQLIY